MNRRRRGFGNFEQNRFMSWVGWRAVVYHSLILLGVVMVTEGVIIDQDSILALRRFKLAILGH